MTLELYDFVHETLPEYRGFVALFLNWLLACVYRLFRTAEFNSTS